MIYSFDDLAIKFKDYTDIKGKIRREIKAGNLIQVARGLYETDSTISGKYLSGWILGPSYLSFDYALAQYGLIPEAVYRTYTSATFEKRKFKKYQNYFGIFSYRDVPAPVYHYGVKIYEENGYSYQIATPEKALCDKLYSISPVNNIAELQALLFEDLRIDENEFRKLNFDDISDFALFYHSKNINLLTKYLRRYK